MNDRYTRLLATRAFEIWHRIAEQSKREDVASQEFDLLSRINSNTNIALFLSGEEAARILNAVTGGAVSAITSIINWSIEMRASVFPDQAAWEEWCGYIASIYEQNNTQASQLPEVFRKTLTQSGKAKDILLANPWLVVFIAFPMVSVGTTVSHKNLVVTFRRYDQLPEEDV